MVGGVEVRSTFVVHVCRACKMITRLKVLHVQVTKRARQLGYRLLGLELVPRSTD